MGSKRMKTNIKNGYRRNSIITFSYLLGVSIHIPYLPESYFMPDPVGSRLTCKHRNLRGILNWGLVINRREFNTWMLVYTIVRKKWTVKAVLNLFEKSQSMNDMIKYMILESHVNNCFCKNAYLLALGIKLMLE